MIRRAGSGAVDTIGHEGLALIDICLAANLLSEAREAVWLQAAAAQAAAGARAEPVIVSCGLPSQRGTAVSGALRASWVTFHGDRPPAGWVGALEREADFVLAPHRVVADRLKSAGLARPVFVAPVAPKVDDLLAAPDRRPDGPLRFFACGALDLGSDLPEVIAAFEAAFGLGAPEARLVLYLDRDVAIEKAEALSDRYRGANVRILRGCWTYAALVDALGKVDVLVTTTSQDGATALTLAAQALGLPQIVADLPEFAHASALGSTIATPAAVPTLAAHPHERARPSGIRRRSFRLDLATAFRKVHAQRDAFFLAAQTARAAAAERVSACASTMRAALAPALVTLRLRGSDRLSADGFVVSDEALYQGMLAAFGETVCRSAHNGRFRREASRPIVHVRGDEPPARTVLRFIDTLVRARAANAQAVVAPDWREQTARWRDGALRDRWPSTADNAWRDVFEPLTSQPDAALYAAPFEALPNALIADDEAAVPLASNAQDFGRWRRWCGETVAEELRPTGAVLERAKAWLSEAAPRRPVGLVVDRHTAATAVIEALTAVSGGSSRKDDTIVVLGADESLLGALGERFEHVSPITPEPNWLDQMAAIVALAQCETLVHGSQDAALVAAVLAVDLPLFVYESSPMTSRREQRANTGQDGEISR